jgi:hypothetical protein
MTTIELFTEQIGPSICEADAHVTHVIYTFASWSTLQRGIEL